MKKLLLICTAILTLAASAKAQEASCQHTDFRYTKTINNSDFINERITNIDSYLSGDFPIDSVFAIVNGKFDIVFFERYSYGYSVMGEYTFSHEVIISKVLDGKIVESYFVPLDWKEPPMHYQIQISRQKLPIEQVMRIKDFHFKPLDESGRNLLEDNCLIIIPDAAMTVFRY